MSPSTLRLSVITLLLAASAHAQTAQEAQTGILDVAQIIPSTCANVCDPWLAAYNACPAIDGTGTTFQTCVCDPTFLSTSTTCLNCITTEYTATNDPNAAEPAAALASLNGFCGNPVAATSALTSSSSSTPLTSDTSTPLTSSSTSAPTTAAAPATTPFSESIASSSSVSIRTGPTTVQSLVTGNAFPTQTKSANVFSGAERHSAGALLAGAAVVAGAFFA